MTGRWMSLTGAGVASVAIAAAVAVADLLPPVHPLVPGGDHSFEDHAGHLHAFEELTGIVLTGADFSGGSLFQSVLRDADLRETNLAGTNLRFADLTGARLDGAELGASDLRHAILVGADLTGANLAGANLSSSDLSDAILTGANLDGTILAGAMLNGVDLSGRDLSGRDLTFTELQGADLTGADLSGSDLTNANLEFAVLEDAVLIEARLVNATVRNADLARAILLFADCSDADFAGSDLTYLRAPVANLTRAHLVAANLFEADLFASNLERADLTGATLTGADLRVCILRLVHLDDAVVDGVDLTFAEFSEAVLLGANLGGANLTGVPDLNEAFWNESTLYRCDTEFAGTGFDPVAAGWTVLPPPYPRVLHVDGDATEGACGTSWSKPLGSLSEALARAAESGGAVQEIWVKAASAPYVPVTDGLGDPRSASFDLVDGVAVYGGFAGDEVLRSERDPAANPSILSGDLDGNDPIGDRSGNSYHVVTAIGLGSSTVLDGITITGGNADGDGALEDHGGGLLVTGGGPTIERCRLVSNTAFRGGGAAYVGSGAVPIYRACMFLDNAITGPGGGGGAIASLDASPLAINCLFARNSAGPIGLDTTGGVAYCDGEGAALFVSCTMVGNVATGGLGGAIYAQGSTITIVTNCILWDNAPDQILTAQGGNVLVQHSIVQGGWSGEGNLEDDPLLSGDLYELQPHSPAIDAGDNNALPPDAELDLLENLRFRDDPGMPDVGVPDGKNDPVDIGAVEFQGFSPDTCPGDINGDGISGLTDLIAVLSSWGPCTDCDADIDGTGYVDFHDLLAVLSSWGPCE